MKTKKEGKLKKGISLIVLVITIIVMIILAATVIISLSNSGIIGKANEAVEQTNLKQVQTIAQTIWAESQLTKEDPATIKSKIIEAIGGEDIAINYDIAVTETEVTVKLAINSEDNDDTENNVDDDNTNSGMYLYNEVELPDINTVWIDKETYPYAYIDYSPSVMFPDQTYLLVITDVKIYKVDEENVKFASLSGLQSGVVYKLVGHEWVHVRTQDNLDMRFVLSDPAWANENILSENNSVYLSATSPVPVEN